jgi:hypothetical protein
MNDDEQLAQLARDRHRATYLELEREKNEMGRQAPRPPHYRQDIPGIIIVDDEDKPLEGCRYLAWGIAAFWIAVILGVALLYSCRADAAGFQVYLEGEDDLGNGFKLCHYTEGYTITIQSHKLCPLSVNTGD